MFADNNSVTTINIVRSEYCNRQRDGRVVGLDSGMAYDSE